jgi:outer membrane biosynthesis protein TonB
MSIETKIDELIQAITANTEALNNVLAAAHAPAVAQAPAPAKKKAAKAEPTPAPEPTPEPAPEPEPTPETLVPAEAPAAVEPEPTPEAEKPAITGETPEDIRNYVKQYQVFCAKTGGDTKASLKLIKDIRDEFKVANLNDLTPEQCGPFMAKIKELLPITE